MAKKQTVHEKLYKAVSRTFTTQYTYTPKEPKKFFEPSQTQPGMAMSIKDVMNRAEQGLPIPSSADLQYGDDPDFIGLEPNMDLVEKQELIKKAQQQLKELETKSKKNIQIEDQKESIDEKDEKNIKQDLESKE